MPFTFDARVAIDRAPADVWAFLADHARQPDWRADVVSVALASGDPMAVGARYEYRMRAPLRTVRVAEQLMEVVEGQRFVVQTLSGPVDLEATTEVEPVGAGASVRVWGRGRMRGWARVLELAGPLLRRRIQHDLERDLQALKRVLEAA